MSTRIAIEGELTVFAVHALKEQLLAAMAQGQHVDVDLSGVSEVDGAGIQLLLAARREADMRGLGFDLLQPSPVVHEALSLSDLTHCLAASQQAPHHHQA